MPIKDETVSVRREDKPLDQCDVTGHSVVSQCGHQIHSDAILSRWFVAAADSATSDTSCLSGATLVPWVADPDCSRRAFQTTQGGGVSRNPELNVLSIDKL